LSFKLTHLHIFDAQAQAMNDLIFRVLVLSFLLKSIYLYMLQCC